MLLAWAFRIPKLSQVLKHSGTLGSLYAVSGLVLALALFSFWYQNDRMLDVGKVSGICIFTGSQRQ
jgi:hypothetical protein